MKTNRHETRDDEPFETTMVDGLQQRDPAEKIIFVTGSFSSFITENSVIAWFRIILFHAGTRSSATAHKARACMDAASGVFADRITGSGLWPVRSPISNRVTFIYGEP